MRQFAADHGQDGLGLEFRRGRRNDPVEEGEVTIATLEHLTGHGFVPGVGQRGLRHLGHGATVAARGVRGNPGQMVVPGATLTTTTRPAGSAIR